MHKFGGSSLANGIEFRRVNKILDALKAGHKAVVVSAVQGVTDRLLELASRAAGKTFDLDTPLEQLRSQHLEIATEILSVPQQGEFSSWLRQSLNELREILRGVQVLGTLADDTRAAIVGYGELWSSNLLCRLRRAGGVDARWCDARTVLRVKPSTLGPLVQWESSAANLGQLLGADLPTELIVTGFIAATPDGRATTLGRDGSDFSATAFGHLLEATEVRIWTDVNGIMTADPRLVPDAHLIDALSYDEAVELAYFGARVLHPGTMAPVIERQIPLTIANTFDPDAPGTRIGVTAAPDASIKGITTVNDVTLFNLEGTGMIGVPGTAERLFGALNQAGVSVVLISQGSSEHSICFVVRQAEAGTARAAVERAFSVELAEGQVERLGQEDNVTILAVVGNGMAGTPGVAGKLFSTLGASGINVKAIAQGASERNISAVIDSSDRHRAVRAVHSGFYLSAQTISIGLIGPGNIGSAFMEQLRAERQRLQQQAGVDLRIRGILSSSRMLLADQNVSLASWRADFEREAAEADMDAFVGHVNAEHIPHSLIIDCTASGVVARHYPDWLGQGIHVITPNKKACTSSYEFYRSLQQARQDGQAHFLYETTVGAGLPVIMTARDLLHTGDEVRQISGIFSGTLAYLFNRYDGQQPFSELVAQARAQGLTEPDPRDDLSGMDVARKLVILARELGQQVELTDVQVESLVPTALAKTDVDAFMAGFATVDTDMRARFEAAAADDKVLRYVGELQLGKPPSVGLQAVSMSHPFANISLTDNIVEFRSERYHQNPLLVQGPGAGPAVTAGGVFADLLRLCSYLGARL